jgi:glycosyltransferase involved in cell wall biosynthesis
MIRTAGKITIIGPVAPFRGGIAQHTTSLANALSEIADTGVISFSRLYPRWLYPGKFQTENSSQALVPAAEFLLDSINPFSWRQVASRIEAQSPSCVIIPWWTSFLAPCYRYLARRLRHHGIAVVFICHNVEDHESAGWKKRLGREVLRHGTWFLVQTLDEENNLRRLLGNAEILYHPHPLYNQFPPAKNLLPRRAALELLFFGFIRPYKGLDVLLDAMSGLDDLSVHLSVIGEPWGESENIWRKRIRDAGIEARVEFVPRYTTDDEAAEYFARADFVVLPYRSATGTGVIAAAYHYRKPVIASNVGGLRDVVVDGKTGLLVPPGDVAKLRTAIRRCGEETIPDAAANIGKVARHMTWPHLARQLLETDHNISEHRSHVT